MFVELTMIDDDGSARPWQFRWPDVESYGRTKSDSATLLFGSSGRSYSVVEQPAIIEEILREAGVEMQVARAAR